MTQSGVPVRWTVEPHQIDLDRWAKAVLRAISAGAEGAPTVVRWWTWPAIAVLAVALVALVGSWTVATGLLPVLLFFGVLVALKLTSERRLAKQLRSVPSASLGFTFVADATGTSRTGPGGSDELPWTRYRAARLDGDIVTLLLDNNTVTVLPVVALAGTDPPDAVVARLEGWIAAGRSEPS